MRWIFYAFLAVIASKFFAGLFGAIAMSNRPPLYQLRRVLIAIALDGLLMGIAVVRLVYTYGSVRSRTGSLIWVWAWFAAQIFLTSATWMFVLDATRKKGASDGK